jgi:hypothetical protein
LKSSLGFNRELLGDDIVERSMTSSADIIAYPAEDVIYGG